MKTPRLAAAAIIVVFLMPAAHAANPMRGQLLYENWCYHCHLTEIHFRVDSKVDSWGKLLQMVAVWQAEMNLGWKPEDVADVASYLNRRYYGLVGTGIE
ncbi:MAG: hypothetical protein LJE70_15260 [Chromatiaceae bacterium]|jgi:mono/diheme cytochrome c family protein|nr:hypothetical protein [Chromatiaceae bacterium]